MKEILIFAGTTEGRTLSEYLSDAGISHTICVATEYGELVLKEHPLAKLHLGRLSQEEMRELIQKGNFAAVVDATHPYATVVTENIKEAMKDLDIPYLRLQRQTDAKSDYEKITTFEDGKSCAKALEEVEGNILLTTGSKELGIYCVSKKVKERIYVRVLPSIESLSLCMEQGIFGKQILALQGPFTREMNEAIIAQYQIRCLVTKKSGKTGGYQEKIEAAKNAGIPVFVVGQAKEQKGYSFYEVCQKLEAICQKKISKASKMEIILAGVGMGNKNTMTTEVRQAIESADILLGAKRMLEGYQPKLEKKPYYMSEQILPYLKEVQQSDAFTQIGKRKIVILFSGDSGFYSGSQKLYQRLQEEIQTGNLEASVRIMPGISSVSYLAACIGESYQDARICSMHGKELLNLAEIIKSEKKLFLLMSGVKDIHRLGNLLEKAGFNDCEISAGYQLSYPEQKIFFLTPRECCEQKEDGLYTCLIKNPKAECKKLTHGLADAEFIRDKVPMTKEEVREVSICKLKLHKQAVVYDVGSGSGSIAVEIARLSEDIKVFAIEQKEEAVSLIGRNTEKFGLENIEIIKKKAPEGLSELPRPTHAFIGGSGGKMKEILSLLYQKNPNMRIVINAISMETICEIKEVLSLYPIEKEEVVQIQLSRAKKAGSYHLMQAENPVWICAFSFKEEIKNEVS